MLLLAFWLGVEADLDEHCPPVGVEPIGSFSGIRSGTGRPGGSVRGIFYWSTSVGGWTSSNMGVRDLLLLRRSSVSWRCVSRAFLAAIACGVASGIYPSMLLWLV